MNSNNNNSIGINSFVKRQIQGSGKTYSTLSFEDIKNHAETQLKSNIYKAGYRDGVILIPVDNDTKNELIDRGLAESILKLSMNSIKTEYKTASESNRPKWIDVKKSSYIRVS